METKYILQADILDIIFDKKNKAYGAYNLRRTYPARMIQSMFISAGLVATVLFFTAFTDAKKKTVTPFHVREAELINVKIKETPVVKLPEPKPQPKTQVALQDVFVPPTIVADDKVKSTDKIIALRTEAAVGTVRIDSGAITSVVGATIVKKDPVQGIASAVIPEVAVVDDKTIYTHVQQTASFPGGNAAWRNFLMKQLDPNIPQEKGAAPSSYTVIVKFVVMKDGSINNIVAETNHGFGMEAEAVRAIKKGPKWTPASQNNVVVNSEKRQPITFVVQEY